MMNAYDRQICLTCNKCMRDNTVSRCRLDLHKIDYIELFNHWCVKYTRKDKEEWKEF